jgi:hypothetical protein
MLPSATDVAHWQRTLEERGCLYLQVVRDQDGFPTGVYRMPEKQMHVQFFKDGTVHPDPVGYVQIDPATGKCVAWFEPEQILYFQSNVLSRSGVSTVLQEYGLY